MPKGQTGGMNLTQKNGVLVFVESLGEHRVNSGNRLFSASTRQGK